MEKKSALAFAAGALTGLGISYLATKLAGQSQLAPPVRVTVTGAAG